MDRQFVYYNQIPLATDVLNAEKFAYVGLAKLAAAVLGAGPAAHGFAVTPGTGLSVNVAAGEFYALAATDGSAYGALPADANVILKQGILPTPPSPLGVVPSPALSAGQRVVFLVQVALLESDINPVVLAYFNPTAPYTPPLNGPSGSGASQPTLRNDAAVVSVLQGAASSGTPVAPSPSAGAMGLYTVTVSFGQASISSGDIAPYAGATLLTETLAEKISLATGLSVFAALDSPPFVGTPTAPTPAQFDSSTTLATTAFATRLGYNVNPGSFITAASSGTLAATVFGGEVIAPASNTGMITLALPAAVPVGQGIMFVNTSAFAMTLSCAGADKLVLPGNPSATGITVGPGDNVLLSVAAAGWWHAPTGSALMGYSGQFANLQAANGYQQLPSGTLLQWGVYATTISAAGTVTITLSAANINFPNNLFSATAIGLDNNGSGSDSLWVSWDRTHSSTSQLVFVIQLIGGGTAHLDGIAWQAIGN